MSNTPGLVASILKSETPAILETVYQEPNTLALAVLPGDSPCPLTVLKKAVVQVDEWQFTFHIIGESHLIRVERNGQLMFQEVLACVPLAPQDCLHHHPFGDLENHHYQSEHYRVAVHFAERPVCCNRQIDPMDESQITVTFPEVCGQIPLTQVKWQIRERTIRWWTLHVYPHETGATEVRSFTHFDLF